MSTAQKAERKSVVKMLPRNAQIAANELSGWEDELLLDQYGKVKPILSNVMLIMTNHPAWRDLIAYNEFTQSVVSSKPPPVRDCDRPEGHTAGEWSDVNSIQTAAWISGVYRCNVTVQTVDSAVSGIAGRRVIHPVREWLRSLRWDGTQRLPTMFSRYFGAEQTPYTSAIGIRFMISAVARVMEPGCKVDNVVTLEGDQGIGKSRGARVLAKREEWFADTGITLGDKDSYQCLRGVWVYELAELSSVKSARDVERYKAFFSSPVDNYRPSYGRRNVKFPRQCVFIGTTNEQVYLNDRSGNRRFWPVRCGLVDLAALARDVDLLWAEALTRYESKEVWHVDSVDLAERCKQEQSEREEIDPWVQIVEPWLEGEYAQSLARDKGIGTVDVLRSAIGMASDRIDRAAETRVGQVLRYLKWEPTRPRIDGVRVRKYFPPVQPVQPSTE